MAKYPESFPLDGTFEVIKTGPSKDIELKFGPMTVYSLQVKHVEADKMVDAWVDLMQKPDSKAPEEGDKIEGTLESSEYGVKLKKAKKDWQGGGGGGGYSAGAAYSAAVDNSIQFMKLYTSIDPTYWEKLEAKAKKEKTTPMALLLAKVHTLAPGFKKLTDELAAAEKPAAAPAAATQKSEAESGEQEINLDKISDEEANGGGSGPINMDDLDI